jgi:CBS domain containing-hemolysin-like protein
MNPPIEVMTIDPESWSAWAKKVLSDIERLEQKQNAIQTDITALSIDIAVLKTKLVMLSLAWGGAVGIVVSILTTLLTRRLVP